MQGTMHEIKDTSNAAQQSKQPHRLKITGLYVTPPDSTHGHYLEFYRACGYNYLEFCELGWSIRPDQHFSYYADLASRIASAKKRGFAVWILLLAGMRQWKGPESKGDPGTFSALEKDALEERLSYIRRAVRSLPQADGFVFFAGDPGGDRQGRSTIRDCISFAQRVHEIVRQEAPHTGFAINLWAVAEWAGYPSAFSAEFWRKQPQLSRIVAEEPGLLGPGCGVSFSLDSYYRSLALTCLSDLRETPPLYPTASDVAHLRKRGLAPILGWPYFLVDECDDGFVTPNNVATGGQSQSETRYIRDIIQRGRDLGLDGMVANAAYVEAEQLNIYAFAQMCHNPRLTPADVLDRYARFVATSSTRRALSRVLRFIENHSSWHNSLPPAYRLPELDCGDLHSAEQALTLLDSVRPRPNPPDLLPEPPTTYLQRLKRRLHAIAAGDVGGPSPHYVPQSRPAR